MKIIAEIMNEQFSKYTVDYSAGFFDPSIENSKSLVCIAMSSDRVANERIISLWVVPDPHVA